ncbi:MAG TPA: entericidin [Alphaproteobacteria bacterium]
MRKLVVKIVFLGAAVLAVSACSNTFDGAGRDIEHVGQVISDTF